MQTFIARHPRLTQFAVMFLSIGLSIPLWIGAWWALSEAGHYFIEQGCATRYPGGCDNDSMNFTFVTLAIIPFFFAVFIWQATRTTSLITNALLRWAGLNPKVALA